MAAPERKFLSLFVAEARDQLAQLEGELVRLGQAQAAPRPEPGKDPLGPLWDSIFRRIHSLKGSAATLELSEMVAVAHAAEELIGRMKARGAAPERVQIDLLLESADGLARLVEVAAREVDPGAGEDRPAPDPAAVEASATASAELAARLSQLAQTLPEVVQTAPRAARPEAPPSADPGLPRLEIKLALSAKCAAPGARALIVQRKLKALGVLLEMEPLPAQLLQARGPGRITALVATARPAEELRSACLSVPEVESCTVVVAGRAVLQERRGASDRRSSPPPSATEAVPHLTPPPPLRSGGEAELRPDATVRVRAESLDQLLDAAGEVLQGIARLREAARKLPEAQVAFFEHEVDRLRRQARELHGRVMTARLTPFSALTERLPRAVRDLAHKLGKEVDLEVQGAEVELDRAVIEAMGDPLSHLVRNAVDHGIEPAAERTAKGKPGRGKLRLLARRERDKVLVELSDDGRGVDTAALRRKAVEHGSITAEAAAALSEEDAAELAFLPGVSTRNEATEVSGRGVGLDAVQRAVESLGGKLSLRSTPGQGASFILDLPRSVSMANLLLVQVGGELYGLPLTRVLLTIEYDLSARGGEGFESRSVIVAGQWVPAYGLAKLFGLPSLAPPGPRPFVVLEVDGVTFALAVDRLVGQEEAVVKPLYPPLDRMRGLAGTTVLGNGRPLLVLDPRGLAELAEVPKAPPPRPPRPAPLLGVA